MFGKETTRKHGNRKECYKDIPTPFKKSPMRSDVAISTFDSRERGTLNIFSRHRNQQQNVVLPGTKFNLPDSNQTSYFPFRRKFSFRSFVRSFSLHCTTKFYRYTCSRTTSPHWLKTFLLSCPCADWPNDMRHSIFLSDDITQVSANFKSKNIFFLRNDVQCFNRTHLLLGDPDVVRNTCLFRIKSLQCRHVLMGLGKCPGDS